LSWVNQCKKNRSLHTF